MLYGELQHKLGGQTPSATYGRGTAPSDVNDLDMTHIQYQGETLPPSPGISVSPGIR